MGLAVPKHQEAITNRSNENFNDTVFQLGYMNKACYKVYLELHKIQMPFPYVSILLVVTPP